jgi:hypothetical protein
MIHIKDKYSRTNIYIQREQSSTDYVTKDYYNDKLKELKKYIDDTINTINNGNKVNINDVKFMYSPFEYVPDGLDWENLKNGDSILNNCESLKEFEQNLNELVSADSMFNYCTSITSISITTPKMEKCNAMFNQCVALETLSEIDCTNVVSVNNILDGCVSLKNFGGFKNLKISIDISDCVSLTRESCINILTKLYNVKSIGETRTLKVHQNFITMVGDDLSIATEKGWNFNWDIIN